MSGKINSLEDLYLEELRDIYSAENQMIHALPKMAEAAQSDALRKGFENHLEQTRKQLSRVEKICEAMEASPKGKKCKGMESLLAEGEEFMKEDVEPKVRDAGLIAAAQRVEHYEMAVYGTARTFARMLGHDDAAELLQKTLNEEAATDEKLTQLAEQSLNQEAM